MSDKLITSLEEKPVLADTDAIVIEGGGATWKSQLSKVKEYIFGAFGVTSTTSASDYVIVKRNTGDVYKVALENLIPAGVITNAMLVDSVSTVTGITESKLAPASVTHPKLAIDSVHTHNIADAEIVTQATYGTSNFGTGITTSKIVDGAVTGVKGGVPTGAVFHFAGSTAPDGYLYCNGNIIPAYSSSNSGAVYSPENVPVWKLQALRTYLAAQFGAYGQLPDLRGIFLRGLGSNATSTFRILIKSGASGATGAVKWIGDETVADRLNTISYTIEFYNDTTYVNKLGESVLTNAQAAALSTPYQVTSSPLNCYYLVYANRRASSAGLGVAQSDLSKQHYHSAPDAGHIHGVSGGGASGNFVTSLNVTEKENTDTGGGGRRIRTVSANTGNVSYTSPGISTATTGIVVARYPDFTSAADETRPINTALLPCIKY